MLTKYAKKIIKNPNFADDVSRIVRNVIKDPEHIGIHINEFISLLNQINLNGARYQIIYFLL